MPVSRLVFRLGSKPKAAPAIQRTFHKSPRRHAVTEFQMPAMSPTMTEGGIAKWSKKEGESFAAGDVLLEIETDKATMDVEAQDDGIMGKIVVEAGAKAVPVGKVIALLAEEGDDISNLEAPKDDSKPSPSKSEKPEEKKDQSAQESKAKDDGKAADSGASPSPASQSPPSAPRPAHTHANDIHTTHPLFPSVMRLLAENGITDAERIKGTGKRGMLTKGDVLAHLGKISSPFGTWKEEAKMPDQKLLEGKKEKAAPPAPPLDGPSLRSIMAAGLANMSRSLPSKPSTTPSFSSIIEDYRPPRPAALSVPVPPLLPVTPPLPSLPLAKRSTSYLEGLF